MSADRRQVYRLRRVADAGGAKALEAVAFEGESYRLKAARARTELKAAQRRAARPKAGKS